MQVPGSMALKEDVDYQSRPPRISLVKGMILYKMAKVSSSVESR